MVSESSMSLIKPRLTARPSTAALRTRWRMAKLARITPTASSLVFNPAAVVGAFGLPLKNAIRISPTRMSAAEGTAAKMMFSNASVKSKNRQVDVGPFSSRRGVSRMVHTTLERGTYKGAVIAGAGAHIGAEEAALAVRAPVNPSLKGVHDLMLSTSSGVVSMELIWCIGRTSCPICSIAEKLAVKGCLATCA